MTDTFLMRTVARAGDERARMGRVAAIAGPLMALVVLASMRFVGFTTQQTLAWATLIVPTVAVAGLLGWFMPWHRWPDAALQSVPLTGFVCLTVLGLRSDGRAAVYSGICTLLFLFIGMTQRPWVSVPWLVAGVPTSIALYGGPTAQLIARLPISVAVWLATAEIVSRYRGRTRAMMTGLDEVAHRDALTGLANRTGLEVRLAGLGGQDAVLLVDLDHFKDINDTAGHGAGDRVLHEFGTTVRTMIRAGDEAIRYGGEEILVLLPGAGVVGALRFDTRLRTAWRAVRPDITYSAGIAVAALPAHATVAHNAHGRPAAPVLARADEALYVAKARGRNRTIAHSLSSTGSVIDRAAANRSAVVADLPR